MTPILGRDLKTLNELKLNKYAWRIESNITNNKNDNYQIIARAKNLNPWILIKKKI